MITVVVNLGLAVLAAIPVVLYFLRNKDKSLAGCLLVLAALFVLCGQPTISALAVLNAVWVAVVVYILHWAAWIALTLKKGTVREGKVQLLSIAALLLTYTLYFGSVTTLVLTLVYAAFAVHVYQFACRNKAVDIDTETSDAPLTGIFKEFAPQRAAYINEKNSGDE